MALSADARMQPGSGSRLAQKSSISVALTTFNGARYLASQLSSIARQTLVPTELVVCDDASTDETFVILQKFAGQAPFPVRIHRNPHTLGFRSNFIQCAYLCTSDLIAFCDQDDIWHSRKLECQEADFQDPEIMLSCHNAELVDQLGHRLQRLLDQYARDCYLDFHSAGPLTFPRGFTQVFRRSILRWEWMRQGLIDIGDPTNIISHDAWCTLLALLQGIVIYHQKPLVDYRQHGTNLSGAVPTKTSRFVERFSSRPMDFGRLAETWSNRHKHLQIFLAREPNLDARVKRRAQQMADLYQKSANAAASRVRFYEAAPASTKLKILATSISGGVFRPANPWAFPVKAIAKDASYLLRAPHATHWR